MLDIAFIRENIELLEKTIRDRGNNVDIRELLLVDDRRRTLQTSVDDLRHQQHEANAHIANASPEEKRTRIDAMKSIAKNLKEQEATLRKTQDRFHEMMFRVPNIPDPSTPVDPTGKNNVVRQEVGTPTQFDFEPRSHIDIGELLDIIDVKRGVKIAGNRGYVLKGAGVDIEQAIFRLGISIAKSHQFTILNPPILLEERFFYGTGHFPAQRDEIFEVHDKERVQFLAGTAEVPLMGYYADEVLQEKDLPIRLTALTPCFRTEVGSYGKDTKGLYRVRQFFKLEQLIICANDPEISKTHFRELLEIATEMLTALELPYRLLQICTGDMGQGKVEEWDIETWMPSRKQYGETHTCSRLHEFQARRLNIKYEDKHGTKRYVHTLNNTIVASPRILIPFLENHQQPDGSIKIPSALRPFLDNKTTIQRPS